MTSEFASQKSASFRKLDPEGHTLDYLKLQIQKAARVADCELRQGEGQRSPNGQQKSGNCSNASSQVRRRSI